VLSAALFASSVPAGKRPATAAFKPARAASTCACVALALSLTPIAAERAFASVVHVAGV